MNVVKSRDNKTHHHEEYQWPMDLFIFQSSIDELAVQSEKLTEIQIRVIQALNIWNLV